MPTLDNRRNFLKFLGATGAVLAVNSTLGCTRPGVKKLMIPPLEPSLEDGLKLTEGLKYEVIAKWGDAINPQQKFGMNCDYTCFLGDPTSPNRDGLLWVNHESINPDFLHGRPKAKAQNQNEAELERQQVGGSVIRITRNVHNGEWEFVPSPDNFRLDASTPIPFSEGIKIRGSQTATGTLGNCSGGFTSWGTVLSAEENYDNFVGERAKDGQSIIPSKYGWENFFEMPPEHYGWVVEIDPRTKSAQKLVSLGRCAHECATFALAEGDIPVVYTGDDDEDQCLYKFIAESPGQLSRGELFVASLAKGEWISLDISKHEVLQQNFKDQIDVLIHLRKAAKLVGGTPLDRPEDIEVDPVFGDILVTLTNNRAKGNHFGSILKITEKEGLNGPKFSHETFMSGGESTGFACPDNMAFDPNGNLWFTTDISGSAIGDKPYEFHGNNALFVVPRTGPQAGEAVRVAQGPIGSELTGPFFSPQGRTLFLSVQHPGDTSTDPNNPTSRWPEKSDSTDIPRSAVVAISGELIDRVCMNI